MINRYIDYCINHKEKFIKEIEAYVAIKNKDDMSENLEIEEEQEVSDKVYKVKSVTNKRLVELIQLLRAADFNVFKDYEMSKLRKLFKHMLMTYFYGAGTSRLLAKFNTEYKGLKHYFR